MPNFEFGQIKLNNFGNRADSEAEIKIIAK